MATQESFQRLFLDHDPSIGKGIARYVISSHLYRNVLTEMNRVSENFAWQVKDNKGDIHGAPIKNGDPCRIILLSRDDELEADLLMVAGRSVGREVDRSIDLAIGNGGQLEKILQLYDFLPATRFVLYRLPGTDPKTTEKIARNGIYFFGSGKNGEKSRQLVAGSVSEILRTYTKHVQIRMPIEAAGAFAARAEWFRTCGANNAATKATRPSRANPITAFR